MLQITILPLRVKTAELAILIRRHPQSIRNQIAKKKFPIPSYPEGNILYFDSRDVLAYLDKRRNQASKRKGRPTKASVIEARKEQRDNGGSHD
jgi:hypothetical protein